MKKLGLLLAVFSIGAISAKAQNLNAHYLYQLNWFNVNPALTYIDGGIKGTINSGTQFMGFDANPTNSSIGVQAAVNEKFGLGAKVISDKRGHFSTLTSEATYAYVLKLDNDVRVQFGISAGMYQTNLDIQAIQNNKLTDSQDQSIYNPSFNRREFMSGFGLYYVDKNLELAASLPNYWVSGQESSQHLFVNARYTFMLPLQNLKVRPMMVYQNLMKSPSILDIGAQVEWNDFLWLQTTYRTNAMGVFGLGINMDNVLFGYLYNVNFGNLSFINKGGHEVLLSVLINKGKRLMELDEDFN